ncbi:hypothetical protein N7491_010646 [Penicillium cf. griseofulvum]|uniref:Uncharacterized protein n=1 Tax=Penicillium cf. griseofulvum TaxID=2972120 RepID=A0A9W9N083_9EURO|nr:hypothetical protein N7472_000974 [Penicillium cf. griseofulvum]KAJ5422201.1 hypothetical protein N7491_010646 [Penicillium cf. griseofulvum]KAJ5428386.1 hypothetical protein N7445_009840 [Penicillium cf. griseofulvum]
MAENIVHEVADQLEGLTAQSPAAQNASLVSAVHVEVTEPASRGSVFNAPEDIDGQVSTPTSSDMTDLDEALLEDPTTPANVPQSVSPGTHFINPTAPRVSYHLSASGELIIAEEKQSSKPTAPAPERRPSPPAAFLSFNRIAKGLPPRLPTTPVKSNTQPPSLAVERILGPKQPIPGRILELLEEWHEGNPDTEHPAALAGRAPSTWKNFQTFNEDGDECELSVFQITLKVQARRTLAYRIMVLHAQNGPEELVVFGNPRPKFGGPLTKGMKGLYLLDWLELEKKGEVQACGLKLWRPTGENKITFSSYMFDNASKCTRLPGPKDIFNARPSTSTPKKQNESIEDTEEVESSSSEPIISLLRSRRQVSSSIYYKGNKEDQDRTPLASRQSWEETVSPVPTSKTRDEFRSLGSPWRPSQKRRRSTWGSNDEVFSSIRYKLMSDVSDQLRIFKTGDAKMVFQKAREFYMGMDNRTGLLCTVPGVEGVRYIGEGCLDEFDILQEDIRRTAGPSDEDRVVEVKPAIGF